MSLNDLLKVGNNIKRIRKDKGISQKDMADKILNIPRSTYSNYENNNRVPDLDLLKKIAEALEVSIYDLIDPIEATRVEFKGDFDLSVFDTRVMKYINDYKNIFKNLYPGLKIDNTIIIQNLIIDIMANDRAKESAGMGKQTPLYQFPVLDKEIITGEKLYNILYDTYFKKYSIEYKQSLSKKANLIIEAYSNDYEKLNDIGINILKEHFRNTDKKDIPKDILKVIE